MVLRMLWSNRIHTDSKYFFHKYTANRVEVAWELGSHSTEPIDRYLGREQPMGLSTSIHLSLDP